MNSEMSNPSCPQCGSVTTTSPELASEVLEPTYCPKCLLPQIIISDKYTLLQKLGEGGGGVVYLAHHQFLPNHPLRVVKFIKPELLADPISRKRFLQEILLTATVSQENQHIVRVFDDFGSIPKMGYFYVMEYLKGTDLEQHLATQKAPLSFKMVLSIIEQLSSAVHAAHEADVIHRDLKPANIFLVERQTSDVFIKVMDFGIARQQSGERITQTHHNAMGTPMYMAPEQFFYTKGVDHRADIYSIGSIFYELLSGHPPFIPPEKEGKLSLIEIAQTKYRGDVPREPMRRRYPISDELENFVLKCLARRPRDRFSSMRALREAFHLLSPSTSFGLNVLSDSGAGLPAAGLATPTSMPSMEAAESRSGGAVAFAEESADTSAFVGSRENARAFDVHDPDAIGTDSFPHLPMFEEDELIAHDELSEPGDEPGAVAKEPISSRTSQEKHSQDAFAAHGFDGESHADELPAFQRRSSLYFLVLLLLIGGGTGMWWLLQTPDPPPGHRLLSKNKGVDDVGGRPTVPRPKAPVVPERSTVPDTRAAVPARPRRVLPRRRPKRRPWRRRFKRRRRMRQPRRSAIPRPAARVSAKKQTPGCPADPNRRQRWYRFDLSPPSTLVRTEHTVLRYASRVCVLRPRGASTSLYLLAPGFQPCSFAIKPGKRRYAVKLQRTTSGFDRELEYCRP